MTRKQVTDRKIINFFEYNIDIENRVLMYGSNASFSPESNEEGCVVNDWSAEMLIKGLHILDVINHKEITIIWNSNGGSWDAGISIYEYIRTLKSPIKMIVHSRSVSMGSIILQSCKKRILTKNASFMIHYGTEAVPEIHSKDFERLAGETKKINELMEQIYLKRIKEKHPRYTLEKLRELMKYDCYMSAAEAVKLGLADKVI